MVLNENPSITDSKLSVPAGACDCHMHIYDNRYPAAPTAAASPPHAPLEAYEPVKAHLGLTRTVVVQPSAYGTDNSCQLDAVAGIGKNARAIVVVDETVSDGELEKLTAAGARGVRFHMFPGGVLPWGIMEEMAARVLPFGWHIQLQMDGRDLAEREDLLKRLPCDLVVDHVGKFLEPVTTDHPGFQTLLKLVNTGRCWVKLSAAYEVSKSGPPLYEDVGVLAKALVKAAPERMVWASNWPHPSASKEDVPDDAMLLDLLLDWAEDEKTRHRILVHNPEELYGF